MHVCREMFVILAQLNLRIRQCILKQHPNNEDFNLLYFSKNELSGEFYENKEQFSQKCNLKTIL